MIFIEADKKKLNIHQDRQHGKVLEMILAIEHREE